MTRANEPRTSPALVRMGGLAVLSLIVVGVLAVTGPWSDGDTLAGIGPQQASADH